MTEVLMIPEGDTPARVLADVLAFLNRVDDEGYALLRKWTPELREQLWPFFDRLPQAAGELTRLSAEVERLRRELDAEAEEIENDEQLADEFHAELLRQGAFSIERHGKIAIAEHPFIVSTLNAIRRARAALHPVVT